MWNCAHAFCDVEGLELPSDGVEWDYEFLIMMRRLYRPVAFTGNWRDHTGDMVLCRYTDTGGLHVGKVLSQGVYHAYRVPNTNSGDTVITAFNMFRFKDIRFYRRK